MRPFFAKHFAKAKRWPRVHALCASGILFLLANAPFHARAQGLVVQVNNISLSGQFSLRGLTADFPFPVMTVITVTDLEGKPLTRLADTTRWLGPQDVAENGRSITLNWTRLLEYHRDNPGFPPNPNLYNQSFGPLFTEIRASTPIPTSTMLVMDVSGSMIEELADAKAGNLAFLDQLRPIDRAGIIQFCGFIKELLPFTTDKAPLKTNIAVADTCPATAIYDALMTAVQATKRENYRRAIILYTDGFDNASVITKQAVIDSAQFYNLPIFTIALGGGTDTQALQDIAANTGGLFFATENAIDFISIYKQLAVLIQNYYVMAHGSPDPARNGTWRVVEATANTPTRSGSGKGQYFVPGRPALQPTDLAVAMKSLTELAIYENGQIINAVQPGERYQYRLSVRNLGPRNAESILLTHALPASVRFLAAAPFPYYTTPNSLVWQIHRLNAGAADSITVTVELAPNVPPTLQRLISSANILAANDNSPANNTARDTVRVLFAPLPQTDVAISQVALTDSFAVAGNDTVRFARSGETYAYRLTVTNRSTITAKNITVTDFLPDSVRAQNFQPLPASINADSIRWLIAKLPPQSSMVLRFDATVSSLMPVGTNLLINKVLARADNENPNRLADNFSIDTVYNVVKPPLTDVAVSFTSRTDTTIVENGRVVNA
ncbi:MAG: VWA domain-containing protein, partial [bacterium]